MDVEMSCAAPEAAAVPVDWRGRPCRPRRHGGMRAAVFVLGACAVRVLLLSLLSAAAAGSNVHATHIIELQLASA
jgi:hypothetical protein